MYDARYVQDDNDNVFFLAEDWNVYQMIGAQMIVINDPDRCTKIRLEGMPISKEDAQRLADFHQYLINNPDFTCHES